MVNLRFEILASVKQGSVSGTFLNLRPGFIKGLFSIHRSAELHPFYAVLIGFKMHCQLASSVVVSLVVCELQR
jgi:hypothetical protein